jgi:hypothetical protein
VALHKRTLVRGVLFLPGIAPVHLGSGDSAARGFYTGHYQHPQQFFLQGLL